MAINNLNPRRVVWFSPNEPSNKYDIWLSRNAHYDENEEPTIDSPYQRGCDYIFKIYDCGKWNPIVGFNSTAANKMNIVKGSPAYTGHEGNSHTDFQEYHLPLFRDPSNSPDELFDAGTVGTVIKEYVTSEEWYYIIHEGGLGLLIEQYYNENPFDLEPARTQKLGGIWADMFSNSTHADTSTANKTYLAQAKYKYQASLNDYNLFVHAKDIIDAINTYQTENPSAPGIQPGGDFEWRFATTSQCGGILSDTHGSSVTSSNLIEAKFYPQGSAKEHRLAVNTDGIIESIINSLTGENSYFDGSHGIHIQSDLHIGNQTPYIKWHIDNLDVAPAGKFARSYITSLGRHSIQWIDIVDNGDNTITIDTEDPEELSISATNKTKIFVPDTDGNVLISTAITTESSGNYRFIEHCVYRPLENGLIVSTLNNLTIYHSNHWVVNQSYIRFRTSSDEKPMLYFNTGINYIPSFSTSELSAVYDSTENINYIQLEEDTDYSVDIMHDWIKLEKITNVYTPNN